MKSGGLQFTVSKVKCGVTRIGDEYLSTKPQGQFCLVTMKVKNIGGEPQRFDGDNQALFDTKGREFSADTEASIYLEDSYTFLTEINPGNTLKGTVVFDIPKKAKPDYLLAQVRRMGLRRGCRGRGLTGTQGLLHDPESRADGEPTTHAVLVS